MKKHFMTGLAVLLPIVLTIIILKVLINLFTKPFEGTITAFIESHDLQLFGSPEAVVVILKILLLFVIGFILMLIGMVARFFLIRSFFKLGDKVIEKIPLINKIYKALRDVMQTIFHEDSSSFSQVVLINFPHSKTWAVGLVTNTALPPGSDKEHLGLITVFVPGTPNPTMGFMLLYKREDVIFIDMPVEDAVRFVVSCGVMYEGFNRG